MPLFQNRNPLATKKRAAIPPLARAAIGCALIAIIVAVFASSWPGRSGGPTMPPPPRDDGATVQRVPVAQSAGSALPSRADARPANPDEPIARPTPKQGVIHGYVTDALRAPLANATLTVVRTGFGGHTDELANAESAAHKKVICQTQADGSYASELVPFGSYTIRASHLGDDADAVVLGVYSDRERKDITFLARKPRQLRIRYFAGGVDVDPLSTESLPAGLAQDRLSAGLFELRKPLPLALTILARGPEGTCGCASWTSNHLSEAEEVRVELKASGALDARLLGTLRGRNVVLCLRSGAMTVASGGVTDNRVQIADIPEGTYLPVLLSDAGDMLDLQPNGKGKRVEVLIAIKSNQVSTPTLALSQAARLRGSVLVANVPVPRASVCITSNDNQPGPATDAKGGNEARRATPDMRLWKDRKAVILETDGSGHYEDFGSLRPGDYTVGIVCGSYFFEPQHVTLTAEHDVALVHTGEAGCRVEGRLFAPTLRMASMDSGTVLVLPTDGRGSILETVVPQAVYDASALGSATSDAVPLGTLDLRGLAEKVVDYSAAGAVSVGIDVPDMKNRAWTVSYRTDRREGSAATRLEYLQLFPPAPNQNVTCAAIGWFCVYKVRQWEVVNGGYCAKLPPLTGSVRFVGRPDLAARIAVALTPPATGPVTVETARIECLAGQVVGAELSVYPGAYKGSLVFQNGTDSPLEFTVPEIGTCEVKLQDGEHASVRVQVVDRAGRPVPNVLVRLLDERTEKALGQPSPTDLEGFVTLAVPPATPAVVTMHGVRGNPRASKILADQLAAKRTVPPLQPGERRDTQVQLDVELSQIK